MKIKNFLLSMGFEPGYKVSKNKFFSNELTDCAKHTSLFNNKNKKS